MNEDSIPINNYKPTSKKIALIVGNEVSGISKEICDLSDAVLHIPMYGKKESLNVSVAGGVAMHVLSNLLQS